MKNVYTKVHNNHLNKNDISGIAVDIRTQSGVTIWCQVRSGEDDKGEGGAEKGGKEMPIWAGDDVWEVGIG